MTRLMSILKVIESNLGTMHRNVSGPNWFQTHEKLEEYYDYVSEVKDDVIEIGLALNFKEPSLSDSILVYNEIEIINNFGITELECFEKVKAYFTDLISEFESVKKDVPSDVSAKFDEYQYYFRKESQYKLSMLTKVSQREVK
jgi:starvation-inducible DNA-binding protein